MAIEKQTLEAITLTSATTLTSLNTFSVVNNSSDGLVISVDNNINSVTLLKGQSLNLSSGAGFELPNISISGSNIDALLITS